MIYRLHTRTLVTAGALAALCLGARLDAAPRRAVVKKAPAAAKPNGPGKAAGQGAPVDPAKIWPASLEKLAGRYVFAQVASPGGLWEWSPTPDGGVAMRQVSINEAPAEFREKLQKAEIVISDLHLPANIDAVSRLSPSRRGQLRFYEETARGRLALHNLPGVGGMAEDPGEYTGPVEFHLDHQSHSNPSVSGVFLQRQHEEPTWGAAALDYANLEAIAIVPQASPPAPPREPKEPGKPEPKNGAHPEAEEPLSILENARVLRSGVEIFAYVEWTVKGAPGDRIIRGSVRLVRVAEGADRPQPPMPSRPQRRPLPAPSKT